MSIISLSAVDLGIASLLLIVLALWSMFLSLGIEKKLILFSLRMTAQLLGIGLILKFLFGNASWWLVFLMSLVMLGAAGREVQARQRRRVKGIYGYLIGTVAMCFSSFSIAVLSLSVIIGVEPWYTPQYAIPLLGMLLGNTMTGISLAVDRLTTTFYDGRHILEQRLMLGQSWQEASGDMRKECMRTGMMPIINSMAAAGIISLPGMMTGQILGGTPPMEAVRYQILIIILIAAGTGFGVICAIWLTSNLLFDRRHRLRLNILAHQQL